MKYFIFISYLFFSHANAQITDSSEKQFTLVVKLSYWPASNYSNSCYGQMPLNLTAEIVRESDKILWGEKVNLQFVNERSHSPNLMVGTYIVTVIYNPKSQSNYQLPSSSEKRQHFYSFKVKSAIRYLQ
ncbi:hypothetical protein PDL71_16975 [Lacibacter sp. MH-610]|uniref:hypothetical protein n=1 Tax=Lacibacter sp. MH-610 TaxID=3020883 RepID=UPI0038929A82